MTSKEKRDQGVRTWMTGLAWLAGLILLCEILRLLGH